MTQLRRHRQRGLMAVELALVFPTVLILVGGSLVLARAYTSDLRLTRLTNEVTRVCTPGIGELNALENTARACIENRFGPDTLPAGCVDGEITLERGEEQFDYVDPVTGLDEISVVHYFDVRSTCRFSTVGTRGVFPVMNLRAQSRMLVD